MLPLDALVLSPMVDVTDAAFRSLAAENGADVTCSEMVAAAGVVHGNPRSLQLLQPWPGESPYGIQLMGGDAAQMAEAVRRAGELKPDFVDINLGCPSPNVLRSEAGGFLLQDAARVGAVVEAVKQAADEAGIPHVSVKLRTGMDDAHLTFRDVGEAAQAAGASWATLHGRTVAQGYQGQADWTKIAAMVEALDIPVVGNGDLREPDDLLAMREQTGCHGFFIARAAMRDPTIFARMRAALDGHAPLDPPGLAERLEMFLTYIDRAATIGITDAATLRRQGKRFVAGAPGAKRLRAALHDAKDAAAIKSRIRAEVA